MLPRYAQALGKPELYDTFKTRFESHDWHQGVKFPDYSDPNSPVIGKDLKGFATAIAV